MNRQDLEQWASVHHHPQLVLTESDVVKPGPLAWKRLLSDNCKKWAKHIDYREVYHAI